MPPSLISGSNKLKLIERNFSPDPGNLFTAERRSERTSGDGTGASHSILRVSNIYFTQILPSCSRPSIHFDITPCERGLLSVV